MNNEQLQRLCLALMTADTEAEVVQILDDAGHWSDRKAWRYYGDMENNFSAVGNQMSRPDAALVEKLVNSIDHRLINACREAHVNPESSDAPSSIQEAVAQVLRQQSP